MIQLTVTQEKKPSVSSLVTSFPFIVGKSASADLRIDAAGVWDRHASLVLRERKVHVVAEGEALVRVNGETQRESVLKNGDILNIGATTVLVALAPTTQPRLLAREMAAWALITLVFFLQIAALVILR